MDERLMKNFLAFARQNYLVSANKEGFPVINSHTVMKMSNFKMIRRMMHYEDNWKGQITPSRRESSGISKEAFDLELIIPIIYRGCTYPLITKLGVVYIDTGIALLEKYREKYRRSLEAWWDK